MSYKAKVGWGEYHTYSDHYGILYIYSKDNGDFGHFTLKMDDDKTYEGRTILQLNEVLGVITHNFDSRSKNAKDLMLVFVRDLNQVRAYIPYDKDIDRRIISGHIEFRCWEDFAKKDVEAAIAEWNNTFMTNGYPYLTPSQMPRKQMQSALKNEPTDKIYPSLNQLPLVAKSVHGGICYARDQKIHYDMLGFDLVSAYIYSIAFKKHACEAPQYCDPDKWECYINAEDYGTIGRYTITYTSVFSAISCFKDVDGNSLRTGTHTVDIALCNIDMRTLFAIPKLQIHEVKCETLYIFKLDYLPKTIRDYCVDIFIQKCHAPEKSEKRKRIKLILNAGLFGNFLHSMNIILDTPRKDRNDVYKKQNKKLCPQWGIFTMAYVKNIVFGIGLNAVEWSYSDTDSVYCKNDTFNIKLFVDYNNELFNKNMKLCKYFGYPDEAAKLGTFEFDEPINRFKANKRKQYWYETKSGKVTVKAAGCEKEQFENIDANIVFSEDWVPPVGKRHIVTWTKGKYWDKV